VKASKNEDNFLNSWQTDAQLGAKNVLQNFINLTQDGGNNLPHTFLFLGPRLVGKYNLAKEFAEKLVLGLNNNSEIFEFDFESGNSLDELRELIKFSSLTGADKNAKKIFLVRNFQEASIAGQNTLLKTLEEPASSSIFILLSNNNSEISTIMSRCVAIRCYASAVSLEVEAEFPELYSHVEKLLETKSGLLLHLKALQELENKDLQLLLQLWVEKLLSLMSTSDIAQTIKKIRVAQNAIQDLKKNYNPKLILQEFLLQTEKLS
jgi:DNA polymerase III delta prime subunit